MSSKLLPNSDYCQSEILSHDALKVFNFYWRLSVTFSIMMSVKHLSVIIYI